jgi:hypothetical protein
MSIFQIITIILSGLGLLGAIIMVYVRTQVDIAKINTTLVFLQRDLDSKEGSILKLERDNKEDHEKIMNKIDLLINKEYGK